MTAPEQSQSSESTPYFSNEAIWTPEIERKAKVVAGWISADLPGSHLWGTQRVGKTEFGRALCKMLPSLLGGTTVGIYWSFLGPAPKTDVGMLQHCLSHSNCTAFTARNPVVLRRRLRSTLADFCHTLRASRIVLVVDEIQNVKPDLYGIFMAIASDLALESLTAHVLSIGQPEMVPAIDLLHQQNALQVIGRLFPQSAVYHGLSVEDVSEWLANIDEGGSFTQKHFPGRAREGWSITKLSIAIRDAVNIMAGKANLSQQPRLPIGYLRPALNLLFAKLATDAEAIADGPLAYQCFEGTGLPKLIRHYVA